jgi:hypothetical protein
VILSADIELELALTVFDGIVNQIGESVEQMGVVAVDDITIRIIVLVMMCLSLF